MRMIVKVGIDSTEYAAGLKKMESGLVGIGKSLAAAFSIGAVVNFASNVARAAGEISDLAEQLNLTTKEVQQLQKAADHSGVSIDKYITALSKIRKLKADFESGDKAAKKTFSETGLNPKDSAFDLLQSVGGLSDSQAFDILGERLIRLKASLGKSSELTELEEMSKETVDALDSAGDRFTDVWRATKAVSARVLETMAHATRGFEIVIDEMISNRYGVESAMERRANAVGQGQRIAPHIESDMNMPAGYRSEGRSAEWVGPIQMRSAGRFSPINLGDRANVGGFFGPNADVNRSMQRNIESMTKDMKEVTKVVVGAAQTAP